MRFQPSNPMPIPNREVKEDRVRKRKRGSSGSESTTSPPRRWRTDAERRIYSSKLLEALRRLRRSSPDSTPRTRAVREAADRALAATARCRTRWSRTILSGGRSLRLKARRRPAVATACGRQRKSAALAMLERRRSSTPDIRRRKRVLGRLVPGCRKASFPTLLEEAADYIAALQMQVRAMSELTEMLSVSGSGRSARLGSGEPR